MADDGNIEKQERKLASEVQDMHLKEEDRDEDMDTLPAAALKSERSSSHDGEGSTPMSIKKPSHSPSEHQVAQSPTPKSENEDLVGGEVTLKQEPGKPPKLSRTISRKVERRPPPMFNDYKDSTSEATSTFQVITECSYANKNLGSTDPALECDCAEEWGKSETTRYELESRDVSTLEANNLRRSYYQKQQCLWRGLRLHQPRHQDGVRAGLRVRVRL